MNHKKRETTRLNLHPKKLLNNLQIVMTRLAEMNNDCGGVSEEDEVAWTHSAWRCMTASPLPTASTKCVNFFCHSFN